MRTLALLFLVACSTTEPPPADPVYTVLWAGHDGVLYMDGAATAFAPIADASVLTAIVPGRGMHLHRDAEGRIASAEVVAEADIYQSSGDWPLTGTVVAVEKDSIQVDHAAIPGLMDAMVMPFSVAPSVLGWIRVGDRIEASLVPTTSGYWLMDVARTGRADPHVAFTVEPLAQGGTFPHMELSTADGSIVVVGEGQDKPTVLTYLYSSCPDPAYCPAMVARLQPLQAAIGTDARIVAVTIDPENDTPEVLMAYARTVGADPATWVFARPSMAELGKLAQLGGLTVAFESGRIAHTTRLLVLDSEGRLVERYDSNDFPQERVVTQLHGTAARKGTDL